MVEVLLGVAIVLAALAVRRLGELLRRHGGDEAAYAYLETRLEDQLRAGMKEAARSLHRETAASIARLSDSVLEQSTQNKDAFEQGVEALAQQVAEAMRTSQEQLDNATRQAALDAHHTGEALVEALRTLHRSLDDTRREMRELHRTVRGFQGPIRNAVAIRQEIRQARERQGAKGDGEPASRSDASAVARTDAAQWQVAAPRPRRLAELLSRVQRRTLRVPRAAAPVEPGAEPVSLPEVSAVPPKGGGD